MLEIGYQIDLDGDDLRDLAAFALSAEAQEGFSLDDVPEPMQRLFLDQPYMIDDLEDFYDRYQGKE